ncbi:glycosyltransferase 2 [Cordyceps javanica]|uniref:Glycosyltransferase 2 n=1 Tax=Cordyceps javanica TaxID=43265 RepID=A0A545V344_9HYPO|nr:glycosyltransferase 2 [Cordyceps javanica]TQW07425.1 glycosyltransferase 2 [Cordyceps javanica]
MTYSPEEDTVRPYSQDRYKNQEVPGVPTQLTAPKATPKPPVNAEKSADHPFTTPAEDSLHGDARQFKGALKFSALIATIRRQISAPFGAGVHTVMFAASNVQSAATVLPMACERAGSQSDRVLFALFGDSDIKLDNLLKLNGIHESCKIMTIDARADQSRQLSNSRLALANARAMSFITTYLRPLSVIVDGSSTEDRPFLDGIKDQMTDTPSTTLIELPSRAQSRLSWMSQLDAAALAKWNDVHFDILIHAPPTGTGNLKRLLRSLAAADLAGHSIPQITIELPPTLDISLERFLTNFKWPAPRLAGSSPNMLTLRHRLQNEKPSASQSVIRLLESFWPSESTKSHALILSPHTEVSPQFFHYVKYALLQRRYGTTASDDELARLMFGISFTVPKTHIHNSKPFSTLDDGSAFVWQAPSSDAMLVFGDKWVELHGYVSYSLQAQKAGTALPGIAQSKEVSESKPAWLEYMLQLCRLRGYFIAYPSKKTADVIVGVYADLPDAPDGREKTEADARLEVERGSSFDAGSQVDMLNTLADGGALPKLQALPILSWDGTASTMHDIMKESGKQTAEFRREVGTCKDPEADVGRDRFAADLFCAAMGDKSARSAKN